MTRTGKIIAGCSLAVALTAAVALKLVFFPAIKDDYFAMNQQSLHEVPSGLLVIRPTHFPKSVHKGIMSDSVQVSGKRVWRLMGRNVSFQQLVAAAYGRASDRVVLPPGIPKTNFDFLVTVGGDHQQQLQALVRKQLGYVAHTEMHDAGVLALEIKDSSLPGLVVSDANAKPNVNFDKGKLHFTHMRLQEVTGGLEQVLKQPVVDKTRLTNFYDFSLTMDPKLEAQLQNESTASATVKKILATWGLGLEQDDAQVEMLVVRSAG